MGLHRAWGRASREQARLDSAVASERLAIDDFRTKLDAGSGNEPVGSSLVRFFDEG